jgi:hypothetical protein
MRRAHFRIGLLTLAALAALAVDAAVPRGLVPSRVQTGREPGGVQVVQADAGGRVFLFRGDALEVAGLDGRGRLGAATRLHSPAPLKGSVDFAAMGQTGDEWLVSAGGDLIEFRDGRSQLVPDLPWMATSIALLDGKPAVGVVPITFGRPPDPGDPPLVMTLEPGGWSRFASTALAKPVSDRHPVDVLFANHSSRLAASPHGAGLWISRPYASRITHYTNGGVPDVEVVLGRGVPSYRRDKEQIQRTTTESARRAGYDMAKTSTIAFTARMTIRGMTVSRDGTLYVVATSGVPQETTALLRLAPGSTALETVPLRLDLDGEASLAAGKDALYLSPLRGRPEVWRLPLEELEQAAWTEVPLTEGRVRKPR